jgi:putative FmdB family regulatory protein
MPIYEIACDGCGYRGEVIVMSVDGPMACPDCGENSTRKLISATSSLTGRNSQSLPGPGDTGCCGHAPGHDGCAGPGSCCGKSV